MNRVLGVSIDILDFIRQQGPVTIAQLLGHFQVAPSTVYNIMQTLESRDMVERSSGRNASYQIGSKAFAIGSGYRPNLVSTVRPHLEQIAASLGMTAILGVHRDSFVLVIDKANPPQREGLISSATVGSTEGLHFTSLGKALLSQLDEDQLAAVLGKEPFEAKTRNTLTRLSQLREHIQNSRSLGFFVDDEEHALGKICVSVPLFDPAGKVVAAISVSGARTKHINLDQIGQQILRILQDSPYRRYVEKNCETVCGNT